MNTHPFAPGAIEHHTTRQRSALRKWLQRTAWLMGFAVAGLLIYASSAKAALVCTQVTRADGTTGQACKNVPDQAGRPPGQAKPKPTPILAPPTVEAPPPAQPRPRPVAENPETPTPSSVNAAPPSATAPGATVMRPEFDQAIAQAAAMVLLTPTRVGATTLNLAAAGYHGQSAVGITLGHRPTRQTFLSLGVSAGTQQPTSTLWRISAGVQF